jgi:hypothetical protein
MWDPLRKILARFSKPLRATLGDVAFETPRIQGQMLHSAFQWRIKKDVDTSSFYIGVKLLLDWPAPGSEDTELGVLMGPEVDHGETEVHTRVQA